MRVLVYAYGTRGDVQPYLALADGLVKAGHDAVLAAPGRFAEFAESHGVEFSPWDDESLALLDRPDVKEMLLNAQSPEELAKTRTFLKAETFRLYPSLLDGIWRAARRGADLLVHPYVGATAAHQAAEKVGAPNVLAVLYPSYVTSWHYPSPDRASSGPGSRVGNRLAHLRYNRRKPVPEVAAAIAQWRRDSLGLAPRRGWLDAKHRPDGSHTPVLHGFSRHLVPVAPDWPDWVHTTGFWQLPTSTEWTPPEELTSFLAAGPKPIFVGFGSMASNDPEAAGERVLAAVREAGVRAIVVTGWGGIKIPDPPENVLVLADMPYDKLFPLVSLAVHAGGAGTLNAALEAGIAQVPCPFHDEQHTWSRRLVEVGVATEPIWQKELTPELLAAAIRTALTDPGITSSVARLRELVRVEHGTEAAVAALEHIAGYRATVDSAR
ncbi:MAG TPA: glycosyltransferase [Pseudonocardiaceae bacterium]